MANYVEYIKIGNGESWSVRDVEAHNKITTLDEIIRTELENMLSKVYPIGSIYMSVTETSPAELFGGTWEQIKDTFLLASGETYTAGNTGGEATHTLTEEEMPNHSHTFGNQMAGWPSATQTGYEWSTVYIQSSASTGPYTVWYPNTYATGASQPHNNMPPYLTVYVWKRTA